MNWLNLRTSVIRAPEYVGTEPIARATWFNVLVYSCEQENGGRIASAKAWKDRQWQQTCGVTLDEINASGPLLTWEGEDLVVWSYPSNKEAEVQARRQAGQRGGQSKTQAKAQASRSNGARHNPSGTQAPTEAKPKQNPSSNPTEREREGEGEGEGKENTPQSPPGGAQAGGEATPATPPVKTATQVRAETLFRRRLATPWGTAELKAWKANRATIDATTPEDWAALEAFYAFKETERHVVYRRQDLATLLNNWAGEIDKARDFRANGPRLKPGARYIANERQAMAEEALMPPCRDMDGNPAEF